MYILHNAAFCRLINKTHDGDDDDDDELDITVVLLVSTLFIGLEVEFCNRYFILIAIVVVCHCEYSPT